MLRGLFAALFALGCSANSTADLDETEDNFTCSGDECVGTYFIDYAWVSGDCGDIPDQLSRFDGASGGDACVEDAPPIVRNDGCTIEIAETCAFEDGASVTGLLVQSQRDEQCDALSGTMTIRAYGTDGAPVCSGTYRFTAIRG